MALVTFALALLCGAMLGASGCSLLHHSQTPQQQFIEALERGNAPEASSLWLHMNPQDRIAFEHGQAMNPQMSPEQLRREVMEKAEAQAAGGNGPGVQGPKLDPGAGLLDLPNYAAPPAAPAYKATTAPDRPLYQAITPQSGGNN